MGEKRRYDDPSLQVSKKYLNKAKFEFIDRVVFYLIPTAQKRVEWLKKKNKKISYGKAKKR